MLTAFAPGADGQIVKADEPEAAIARGEAIWIDLFEPTAEEERRVEQAVNLDVPTKAERVALEHSARFYHENGALVLTATMLSGREGGRYIADAVSFVLASGKLITVRHIDSRAFQIGAGRASARVSNAKDGPAVFMALLESVIERVADIIQDSAAKAQALSQDVFNSSAPTPNMNEALGELGRLGGILSLCQESLASLDRLATFAQQDCEAHGLRGPQLAAASRDTQQLAHTAEALQGHLIFLLDAALGLVASAQNSSLQRLSVAALAFAPPTLIASAFGMNFKAMTIFNAPWGPWLALGLMAAATGAALSFAKSRRWI